MQLKTAWWSIGLVAALAVVVLFGVDGITRRATSSHSAQAPLPTSEERALQVRYLTGYAGRKFAPLLALLATSISAAEEKRLGEILAEREIIMANARENAASSGLSLDAYCDAQGTLIEARIEKELGDTVAGRVRDYLHSLPQRMLVGSMEHVLIYRGAAMTVEQMEQLTALLSRREVPPVRRPSADEWARYLADKEDAQTRVLTDAAEFLSPPQRAALREELELQVGLLRMQGRSFVPANRPRASGALDATKKTTLDQITAGPRLS